MKSTKKTLSSTRIKEVSMGFWPAKTLLSAVELGLFTTLGAKSMTADQLRDALGLHRRAAPDFFDALVALRFLDREGDGLQALYRNTEETQLFLDRNSDEYMGGFLEMANARLYRFWATSRKVSGRASPRTRSNIRENPCSKRFTAIPSGLSSS